MKRTLVEREHMMRERTKKLARHALQCRKGTAATEFALLLPVLILLFFGLVEASDAMTVNRKVTISGNTMADLTAQSTLLTRTDLNNLLTGVITILEPNDTTNLQINIVSVILESGNPIVHWSHDNQGNEPYVAGAGFAGLDDNAVLNAASSLIVVEVTYPYTSDLSHFVIKAPLTFDLKAVRWPRVGSRVQLCTDPAYTNCTS